LPFFKRKKRFAESALSVYDVLRFPAVLTLEKPQKVIALGNTEDVICGEFRAKRHRYAPVPVDASCRNIDQHAYDSD